MNNFTNTNLDQIRADIKKALNEIGQKHGISLDMGNISYESTKFSSKITGTVGDGSEHAKKEFERNCWRYQIPESWYGKQFTADGQTFEITGITTRARKNPINFKDVKTNKSYKAAASYVKRFIKD